MYALKYIYQSVPYWLLKPDIINEKIINGDILAVARDGDGKYIDIQPIIDYYMVHPNPTLDCQYEYERFALGGLSTMKLTYLDLKDSSFEVFELIGEDWVCTVSK
ncbi:MAG: hypothetical protein V4543_00770 [Bacteroidota bacterium]